MFHFTKKSVRNLYERKKQTKSVNYEKNEDDKTEIIFGTNVIMMST